MAYYLGRDLDIALTTEHATKGLVVKESSTTGLQEVSVRNWADGVTSATSYDSSDDYTDLFAAPRNFGESGSTLFGDMALGINPSDGSDVSETWDNRPDNVTGIDLSLGTMDEDVQFIGQRNVLKAEIKKENTVTMTRKKNDEVWNTIYNEARFGLDESGTLGNGHYQPDFTTYGYRVALKFKDGAAGEVFVLPNCCITEYSVTLTPDASQEESLTFMSYVNPIVLSGADNAAQDDAAPGGL
tara:strand:+ start:1663 stop:2388 length:726 start_codon:yes stop_codon:yes gene_type:complete